MCTLSLQQNAVETKGKGVNFCLRSLSRFKVQRLHMYMIGIYQKCFCKNITFLVVDISKHRMKALLILEIFCIHESLGLNTKNRQIR